MMHFLKNVIKKTKYGQKIAITNRFLKTHGYPLNYSNPETLNEKIQWIKLYGKPERFAKYVDKFEVRSYVKFKIGEEHLIPLIGVYKSSEEVDFDKLPESFIIKATHASGWNFIVKQKSKVDLQRVREKIDYWSQSSFYKVGFERNYKPLKGRVVIEKLINDPSGDLMDYKFFCFHGEPTFIQVDGERFENHKRNIYNLDWVKYESEYAFPNFSHPIEKPKMLNQMIDLARSLSEDFAFVRVDLYCTEGKIFFGELTFTPDNGFGKFSDIKLDKSFGKKLDLKQYNKY